MRGNCLPLQGPGLTGNTLTVRVGRRCFLELPEKHPWQLHGWHDLHQIVPSVGGQGMLFLLCYSKGMRRIRKFWEASRKFWRESTEMLLASASCIKFISSNNTDTDSESPAFPPRVVMNLILLTYSHHLWDSSTLSQTGDFLKTGWAQKSHLTFRNTKSTNCVT